MGECCRQSPVEQRNKVHKTWGPPIVIDVIEEKEKSYLYLDPWLWYAYDGGQPVPGVDVRVVGLLKL